MRGKIRNSLVSHWVRTSDEVAQALASGGAVVALETAAVTHGLPRTPLATMPEFLNDPTLPRSVRACFGDSVPVHRALGHALAAAVRAEGAVPATVGMLRGTLVIGLSASELDELADMSEVHKIAARDVALVAARRGSGGTTVAGTLFACQRATPTPIKIFATGGIGGVHRGFAQRPDISADLFALRETSALVVCAGAKSILDLPATVEMLDTLGVPLIGLNTTYFPRFLCDGAPPLLVNTSVTDEREAAYLFATQQAFLRASQDSLQQTQQHTTHDPRGMLLCVPPPAAYALQLDEMERAVDEGLAQADRVGARGPDVTPVLLDAVARATQGRSLACNLAVLVNNARVAARVAVELTRQVGGRHA